MFSYFDMFGKWMEYKDFVETTIGKRAIDDPELIELPRDPDEKPWRNKKDHTYEGMEKIDLVVKPSLL